MKLGDPVRVDGVVLGYNENGDVVVATTSADHGGFNFSSKKENVHPVPEFEWGEPIDYFSIVANDWRNALYLCPDPDTSHEDRHYIKSNNEIQPFSVSRKRIRKPIKAASVVLPVELIERARTVHRITMRVERECNVFKIGSDFCEAIAEQSRDGHE